MITVLNLWEYQNLLEYQNIKMFLRKAMFQISLKKFLWSRKLKALTIDAISDLNRETFEHFTKKNCKKQIKKSLELKK